MKQLYIIRGQRRRRSKYISYKIVSFKAFKILTFKFLSPSRPLRNSSSAAFLAWIDIRRCLRENSKNKMKDHRINVYYGPNRPISFPNDRHLGNQSNWPSDVLILTWSMVKERQHV